MPPAKEYFEGANVLVDSLKEGDKFGGYIFSGWQTQDVSIIEDDSNIYYSKKKYDAYFTMKHPILINENNNDNNGFSLEIDL